MREREIILAGLPQSDGNIKLRPVLLLKQLPGHNDFLVCGISTQLHQLINTNNKIPGNIGRIDGALHKNLLERLAKYLMK